MTNHQHSIKRQLNPNKLLFIVLFIFSFSYTTASAQQTTSKILFWDNQKKGANIFNQEVTREDIKTAKTYGISFIRLAPDKFLSKERDFLVGNADHYEDLVREDLISLRKVLDICAEEKMPVLLTILSLPGSRWKQNNGDKDDLRIWSNIKFQEQAAKFWQDLATELRDHPAIIGYNILNEPHPERIFDASSITINQIKQRESQEILFQFYSQIISAIRIIDKQTPIIIDSTAYADANTFKFLKPQLDDKIIYSFHMYEPYFYTNLKINQGKFSYPGVVNGKYWDKAALRHYMQEVRNFQKNHKVSSKNILVGEFGGNRMSNGLEQYFKDLIEIFNENKWHWAFYAFREDVWDGMDYELGDKKLPYSYWKAIEEGNKPTLNRRENYVQFKVLLDNMK